MWSLNKVFTGGGTHEINSQLTEARDSLQKVDIKGRDVILGKISVGGETTFRLQ